MQTHWAKIVTYGLRGTTYSTSHIINTEIDLKGIFIWTLIQSTLFSTHTQSDFVFSYSHDSEWTLIFCLIGLQQKLDEATVHFQWQLLNFALSSKSHKNILLKTIWYSFLMWIFPVKYNCVMKERSPNTETLVHICTAPVHQYSVIRVLYLLEEEETVCKIQVQNVFVKAAKVHLEHWKCMS